MMAIIIIIIMKSIIIVMKIMKVTKAIY